MGNLAGVRACGQYMMPVKMTCRPDDIEIRDAIRRKYREVAVSAVGKFKYLTGRDGAEALGYDAEAIDRVPDRIMQRFCGVGNPLSLDAIEAGATVLDVGCGAGFDLSVASAAVGPPGRVTGIDVTPEMIGAAEEMVAALGLENVEVREGDAEAIPCPDASFDVVISSGVLNLSPHKERALGEIHRVLRPGGHFFLADIVLDDDLPRELIESVEAWSQ